MPAIQFQNMFIFRASVGLAVLAALFAVFAFAGEKTELPGKSLIPQKNIGQFIVDRLDVTTFRSSLGPRRSPGMRHFSDLGMKPTRVEDKRVEFDSDDWLFHITVLERVDKNSDGIEDLVVEIRDQSKKGSYQVASKLLLTRRIESGDLIALAFEP